MLRAALLGVAAAFLALMLRAGKRPEIAALVALAAGVAVLGFATGKLVEIVAALGDLSRRGGVDGTYFAAALKITGVAAIAELGAYTCRDVGEEGLSHKIELGGKIAVLALSVPVLTALMDLVLSMLP